MTIGLSIVSLVWNVGNTLYTRHSNKRNTRRVVNLEEFRARVRDPLEASLRKAEETIREISQLARQCGFEEDSSDKFIALNQDLVGCLSEIQDRLMDADESRFASDVNWLDMYDPAEDQMMHHMNCVLDSSVALDSRHEGVRKCRASYRRFRALITSKIEDQVVRLSS